MSSPATRTALRYAAALAAIAGVTAFFKYALRGNPTTVALTFLILVLLTSAYWGFRLACVVAVVATAAFNYYFLPPYGTFTISDPHNWVALLAFLVTALVASDLAERARREALQATRRRQEVERLYAFSQRLLTAGNPLELMNNIPTLLTDTFGLGDAALWITSRDTIYRSHPNIEFDGDTLKTTVARGELSSAGDVSYVPLRIGMRSTGALALIHNTLSRESQEAIGSLIGIAIERARALEDLAKTQASQESERLRSALMDSVTHEFRTPLTGIKASVTSLLSGYDLDDGQKKELLTVIDEETDRLNRLVGEAAEMALLDSQMFKLEKKPQLLADVIEAALSDTRVIRQEHPVEVKVADGLPKIAFDFERIREVLMHLIENAAKYSPTGTPIRISASAENGSVMTSVADRGPGIDPLEQSLIFDKFYRGREQRYATHGTGMGLAICKVIVEAHGGTIGLVSQVGNGSVFSFCLPMN